MSIKKYTASKDNTIASAFKLNLSDRSTASNMGASDILEVFSIFGQASSSSLEQSRILIQFPVDLIQADRASGAVPGSGSVNFKLRMYNAEHNQTVPEKVTLTVTPIVKSWNEGGGLDMETYLDEGPSSWHSASSNVAWANTGGDFLSEDYMNSTPIPIEFTQYLQNGTEDVDIDITPFIEQLLVNQTGASTPASGSVIFNMSNPPSVGEKIKIYAYNGDFNTFQFANTTGSLGTTHFVQVAGNASQTAKNFIDTINVSSSIKDFVAVTGTDNDLTASLTQRVSTYYGNTVISSSAAANVANVTSFSGGTGALNYGVLIKLSGSLEDGSQSRSYYTKKFFARSSHHFLQLPVIEAQWDTSVKDDRSMIAKSSSLASSEDNLNNIFLYNRIRGSLQDIPSTGSNLLVKLVPSLGSSAESIVQRGGIENNFITASRHSKGIYKATFAYSGSQTSLTDVWMVTSSHGNTLTELYSGSAFSVTDPTSNSYYEIPRYVTNITNLKPSYESKETATFRVYTRNKNWKPNIYTVARQAAPVNVIRDGYYKVARVADDFVVVPYSTSSAPSYSSLSYDISGSYFDLDMSILEPNYLYEICFLYKDGTDYIEQKEKFKFRVD